MIHGEELNKLLQLAGKLGLFDFTLHAQKERLAEDITAEEVREVLTECELLEEYEDTGRGESCLVTGLTNEARAIHLVCAPKPDQKLIIITVYIPNMPKWKNPRERNR